MNKTTPCVRVLLSVAILASAAVSASASAQPPPETPPPTADTAPPEPPPPPLTPAARADAMFQKGKRLLEEGQVDAACKELAESDALDPTVGTLGLLAACHEQQGRVATAWAEFRETARRAEAAKDGRAAFAKQRAAALEARLPKLSIRLARPARPGVVIRRNDEPVPAAELGIEVPVDPGPYEVVARAPGGAEQRRTVIAQEGAAVSVDLPDLPQAAPPPSEPTSTSARLGARWPAGLIAGGVGLVGLGVGAAMGVSAMNQNLESNQTHDTCTTPSACAVGRDQRAGAFRAATISTIGFGVGVAGIGLGAALLLWPTKGGPPAAGRGVTVAPLVASNGGGAFAQGVF